MREEPYARTPDAAAQSRDRLYVEYTNIRARYNAASHELHNRLFPEFRDARERYNAANAALHTLRHG